MKPLTVLLARQRYRRTLTGSLAQLITRRSRDSKRVPSAIESLGPKLGLKLWW